MKQWVYQVLSFEKRAPSIEETISHGLLIKAQNMNELADEKLWKCSKGWAKRFLVKNGFMILD